jgi:hypothetical protein
MGLGSYIGGRSSNKSTHVNMGKLVGATLANGVPRQSFGHSKYAYNVNMGH